MTFTLVRNIEQPDMTEVSRHRTLRGAGRAYQERQRGSLAAVIDAAGKDVTQKALDAANGFRGDQQ